MNAPFDTLAFAHALRPTALGEHGSEALARAIADIAMTNVATKPDLDALKHSLTVRMGAMIGGAVAILGVLISMH